MFKTNRTKRHLQFGILSILLLSLSPVLVQAQDINWYAVISGGVSDMRNFNYSMYSVAGYGIGDEYGNNLYYKYRNKPMLLAEAGIGATGKIGKSGLLSWDTQLNIKTGGFRIYLNVLERNGEVQVPPGQFLTFPPRLGETADFRHWSLHLPLSLNYLPFEAVGFKIGADINYQLSADPSSGNPSRLEAHVGVHESPVYMHPFIGSHVGVFVPFSDRFRFDAQMFTDIGQRLSFRGGRGNAFREMGISISVRYIIGN